MQTFEEFLDAWYEENINNNSNNMNEAFEGARDRWYSELDVQELMDFGQMYGAKIALEVKEQMMHAFKPMVELLEEIKDAVVPPSPHDLK